MKQMQTKRWFALLLCILLIAAMAVLTTGCDANTTTETPAGDTQVQKTVKGEGKTVFDFTVVNAEGKETAYEIHTDEKTVGAALLKLGLIAGDDGDYGLYVKTVDGITVDYDKDGKYWAFYADGAYATAGVDKTDIKEGASYAFKVE